MSGSPPNSVSEVLALALLAAILGAAVLRPRNLNEAVFAVPAAALLVGVGAARPHDALERVRQLAPTVVFLVLILAFGHLCAEQGVFAYLGSRAARASRGSASRLLVLVVALAAAVTAVLTLDATVVLLTPVVLQTARRLGVPARPHLYACTQLANAGSLLLPVSNLTNLLAFTAAELSFARFSALMALPWLATAALEWLGLRLYFRADLRRSPAGEPQPPVEAPRYGLVVVGLTVAGFVATSAVDVAPAWAAGAGLLLLAVPALRTGRATPGQIVRAANLGFGVFVLALGVVVDTVLRHGLAGGLRHVLPGGTSLPALLAIAFVAAALANLVNNLPATLALVPLAAGSPVAVLAVLIGVNIGPNASYAGSLATLLWRRLLPERHKPRAGEFHGYGLLSVPVLIAVATVLLWAVDAV